MKLFIFSIFLAITMVTNFTEASKEKVLHRARRSVIIKTMHKMWLSRHRRDLDPAQLIALRKKLTRMRRSMASGQTQVIKVEIKFKNDFLHHMYEHESTQYRLMDGNIQDAIFTELFGDSEFIESKVITMRESEDKKILADIEFDFDQNEEDPLGHLRAIVATGRISGMEVYKNYFVILGSKEPPKPSTKPLPSKSLDAVTSHMTYPPTKAPPTPVPPTSEYTGPYQEFQYDLKLKQPWDKKLSDQNSNETKSLEDHIQNIIKIVFDKVPNFVDDQVESISNGPDAHPFVRILLRFKPGDNNPGDKIRQLVKSGLLGDIPIFSDYLNGQIPGTEPPPPAPKESSAQTPRPTKAFVPYHPPPQDNVQPPAPVPTQGYVQTTEPPPPTKSLSGHFTLDQTWYPFMDNVNSATDRILSDDIAKAIKDAFKPLDVGVKITSLSRSPDGKIQVNYVITFPPNVTPSLKPLNDAMANGFLGGFPIYTGKQLADITTPATPAPTTPAAPTIPQSLYNNQTSQASYPQYQTGQTGYPTETSYTGLTNQTSYSPSQTWQATTASPTAPPIPPLTEQNNYAAPSNQTSYTGQTGYTGQTNQTSYTSQTAYASPTAAPTAAPTIPAVSDVPILPANPPVVKYEPGIVPLPKGIPHSCEEIRTYGIGNKDGEYVIKARPKCHISIICQNMDEPHPKEYLGGPAQKQWMYYHYAALIKLSTHDKESIDKRACLENTSNGREFIAKVMAADASQGNPLVPWKTNIKRMIHSYIGDKRKKRRSLEDMDITLCTKAITIYKRYLH